jgi:iron complex outermembrane receptor protein
MKSLILRVVSITFVFGAPLPQAIAQDAVGDDVLEEIIVTSRRYEESLQDVPVAVNVMTDQFIEEQGIMTVDQILNFSPGGSYTAFNKMQHEYGLRGVSSQSEGAAGDSSIVTVIDNVVITHEFLKSLAFFDLDRVEVLRGPQGTSFGRNASSGLVHLVTARPRQEGGGNVRLDVGDYGTYGVEAFVTGGFSDNAAGRLAINYDTFDGYTRDTGNGRDLGGEENFAVRGSLLFNPSEAVEIFLKAEFNSDDDSTPTLRKGLDCTIPYQGDFPQDSVVGAPQPPWTQFPNWIDSCDPWETRISEPTYLGDFFLERDIMILTADISWEVSDGVTLTTVAGYVDGDSDYLIDAHGGPNNSMFQSTQNDAESTSIEFRLDNHASGNPLRWLAGVYLLSDEQTRNDQNIFYVEDAVFDPQHPSGFRPEGRDVKEQHNETDSFGVFGELSFDFSDRMSGTVGVRYSEDDKDYLVAHYGWGWGGPIELLSEGFDDMGNPINGCVFAPGGPPDFGSRFCGDPASPVGFTTPAPASHSWDDTSYKASLQFQANDEVMLYGSVSTGYKTGGFQSEPANPDAAAVPYSEENVTSYELGFKAEWGGRFRLNAAAFFADYEDMQLFLFKDVGNGNFTQVTDNAADAEIQGIEVEYTFQFTDNFRLSGTLASIDAELVNALIDTDGDGTPEDFSGTRPDNTAEFTATVVASLDIPLGNGSDINLRLDWRSSSDVYDDIGEQPDRLHGSYDILGARATWTSSNDRLSVALWGRNLTEEVYTVNVGPAQPNIAQLNFSHGAPRVIGASLSYGF